VIRGRYDEREKGDDREAIGGDTGKIRGNSGKGFGRIFSE